MRALWIKCELFIRSRDNKLKSLNCIGGKQVDVSVAFSAAERGFFSLVGSETFTNEIRDIGMPFFLNTNIEWKTHKLLHKVRREKKTNLNMYRCCILSATYFCQRIFMFFALFRLTTVQWFKLPRPRLFGCFLSVFRRVVFLQCHFLRQLDRFYAFGENIYKFFGWR